MGRKPGTIRDRYDDLGQRPGRPRAVLERSRLRGIVFRGTRVLVARVDDNPDDLGLDGVLHEYPTLVRADVEAYLGGQRAVRWVSELPDSYATRTG